MKVLHFIHGLNTGGAETLVKNYYSYFERAKNDYVLLCLWHYNSAPHERELENKGVSIIYVEDYLPFKKTVEGVRKIINNVYKYIIVRRIIKKESPDIIHSHLRINKVVKFAKPKKGTVIFHTIHSDPKAVYAGKEGEKEFLATRWLVRKYGLRFIVLHEQMRKEINSLFGVSDSIVLNNGVDVDALKNARDGKAVRGDLNIPNDSFVLGHIGRFSKVKNQSFLVDIFAHVLKQNKKAFLLMIGNGPDKDRVVDKLEKFGMNNRYLILSNRNDVPDLLSAMDVFVFPSLYEGLPLSLVEAQIARKPCFVSDQISQYAIISNIVERLSLDDGAKKWASGILNYKKPARIVVEDEDWNIKNNTKQLEQIYLDALAERQDGKK